MKFNMHPLCNIMDFDIKRGMAPLLMTANYSLHDVRHLMYLEIYSLFYKKPLMPLSTLPNDQLWMYMYLNYKHLKQCDILNILTQHLLLCKQGYNYKWKVTNNFVIVKTKCQNQRRKFEDKN